MTNKRKARESVQEAEVEIHIAPDGRVFVFGLSRSVLEAVACLRPGDEQIERRLQAVRREGDG